MITLRGLGPAPTLITTQGLGVLPSIPSIFAVFASITLFSAVMGSPTLLPRS